MDLAMLELKEKTKIRGKTMFIASAKLSFYIPHSTSLKDKRQVRRSLIDKTRQRFNVSVAEVDTQDIWQTLTIGIALVSSDTSFGQRSLDEIIRFMEEQANAELTDIEIMS